MKRGEYWKRLAGLCNEEVRGIVGEGRSIISNNRKRKRNYIRHCLGRECLMVVTFEGTPCYQYFLLFCNKNIVTLQYFLKKYERIWGDNLHIRKCIQI